MPSRTTFLRAAAVATAGLLALPAAPASADDTTVVDVLKVVDGEYVVETVRVPLRTAEATAEDLEERADVVVASPQVVHEVDAAGYDPYWDTSDPQATSRVRDVWARTQGEGQVVAVLDTAASLVHEDLIGLALPGVDLTDGTGDSWHGVGVAGVIAARAGNGVGSAGMAPAAKLLPVRVCATGGCPSAAISRGILWAADHGADVINMSLAGPSYSDVTAAAVQYALDKGISVVASAGNDGLNGNPVMYPAALAGVIGVSSTAPSGAPSDWAVHGWQVDISTVGDSVLLTYPGNSYASGSGTSFSGPAVAGAAALLRSSHPGITPAQVQAALQAGVDSSGTWDRTYGAGRLDVPGAMAAADRSGTGGVTVVPGSGAVDVSWDPVAGATGYSVRVDGVMRATVTGTSARITGLTDGNQVAVDVQPENGTRTAPVLATVAPSSPATPTLHSASLSGTSTSATLTLSASVSGPAASRYAILRDGVSIGSIPWALTGTPSSKGIGIGAMPTAQTRWQLRPVDSYAQLLPASNTVTTGSAVPAAPAAPTGLSGRIQAGEVMLTWDDRGTAYTYRVTVGSEVVAAPTTAGVALPAPPVGESRTYQVATVDGWSQIGPAATTTVAHALTAPGAPSLGTPTARSGAVDVRWDAPVEDGGSPITGYTVRALRDGQVVGTTTTGPDQATATVHGLVNGTAYTFTVAAINAIGTGAASTTPAVVPVTTPGVPVLGTATPGDGSVVVRWSAPQSTGGSPVTGYSVQVLQGSTTVRTVTTDASLETTVTGLVNGTAYSFAVAAVNAVGTGTRTTAGAPVAPSAAATAPAAPVVGSPTGADGSAVVRWSAPPSDGGSPITGYTVHVHQGGSTVASAPASAGATQLTVTGLTNGTAYRFTVTAANAIGTSGASALSAAVTPGGPVTVPSAPTIGTPTPGDGWVIVRWAAPVNTGGAPLSGFVVRAHRADGTLAATVNAMPEDRSAYVTGLTNGSAYTFTVVARNSAGTGPASAATAPVTPGPAFTPPGAPVIGTVTPGDGSAYVSWQAPASDGGSPITGYTVLGWIDTTVVSSTAAPAGATSLTVPGLQNGTAYSFTVTATNAAGAGPGSDHSDVVTPSGPSTVTAPTAPGIGNPTTYKASARVRWSAPADDGGAPLTGYQVRTYRGTTLVAVTSAPAGTTSVAVTGLTLGRAHTFAVAAVNEAGTGGWSQRSVAVTPRTMPGAPTMGTVTPARSAVVVKWAAPASNGGAAISGYVVRAYSGGKLVKAVTVSATARSVTVPKLTPGRSYTFRVQAKNVVGGGTWSAASKAVKPNR
jgi:hypothetical protein